MEIARWVAGLAQHQIVTPAAQLQEAIYGVLRVAMPLQVALLELLLIYVVRESLFDGDFNHQHLSAIGRMANQVRKR